MLSLTNQTGNIIILHKVPNRIISLVPSQTELLSDLDVDEVVVGITKFCVHPGDWFKAKNYSFITYILSCKLQIAAALHSRVSLSFI